MTSTQRAHDRAQRAQDRPPAALADGVVIKDQRAQRAVLNEHVGDDHRPALRDAAPRQLQRLQALVPAQQWCKLRRR